MAAKKAKAGGSPPTEQELKLVAKEPVPEIYIDGFQGVLVRSGCAKLNLFSDVQDLATMQTTRQIVARLTMPMYVLLAVHEALGRIIAEMEQDGLLPRPPEKAEVEK